MTPQSYDDALIAAFAVLFEAVEPETPEEIDAALREAGYDPEAVAARFRASAARALAQAPCNQKDTP